MVPFLFKILSISLSDKRLLSHGACKKAKAMQVAFLEKGKSVLSVVYESWILIISLGNKIK